MSSPSSFPPKRVTSDFRSHPPTPAKRGLTRVALVLGSLALALVAIALAVVGTLEPSLLRSLADRLAEDGSAATLDGSRLAATRQRILLAGGLFGLASLVLFLRMRRVSGTWPRLRAIEVLRRFWRDERGHAWLLLALTVLNASLALLLLSKPIACDEAYTALFFANRSPLAILCNYISPNNHVLHSIAAHVSLSFFGTSLEALRVPAVLAGIASVPLGYVAARVHHGRRAGLIAAVLVATWPYLLDVDTSARGYSILHLCVLACIALVPRLRNPRARWSWRAFAVVSTIGFATVPVMLFPFAFLIAWLAWRARSLSSADRRALRRRLTGTILLTAVASLFFYLPTLVLHGSDFALTRDFVRPRLPGSDTLLLQRLRGEFSWTWIRWSYGVATWLLPTLLAFAALGWCFAQRAARLRAVAPLVLAALSTLTIVGLMWKVPPGRCTGFLLLLAILFIAGGLDRLVERLPASARGFAGLVLAALAVLNVTGTIHHHREHWKMPWYVGYHDAETAAHTLQETMTPRDRIAGIREERPPVHYYYHRAYGRFLRAFYPFTEEERENVRLSYDMRAEDRPADVDRVFLFDSGGDLSRLEAALLRSGFAEGKEAIELPHSRIRVFENTAAEVAERSG